MARPLRIQLPGLNYHVNAGGNGGMDIYLDDRDRLKFLELLADATEKLHVDCNEYCLMSSHWHAVLTTPEGNLCRFMKQVNGTYAQWWNKRHRRRGHVFNDRFHSKIIQDGAYYKNACRYVVMNPRTARMVRAAEDWKWSSFRATAGLLPVPSFLRPEKLWSLFDANDTYNAVRLYRQFVSDCSPEEAELPSDIVLGEEAFVAQFKPYFDRASREVPRFERRPALESVFGAAITADQRCERAIVAYEWGYTMVEIATFLALHPSTVSRMVRGSGKWQSAPSAPQPA